MSSAPKRPKLVKKCSYMGYDSEQYDDRIGGNIKFFQFPKEPIRCRMWANRSGTLYN